MTASAFKKATKKTAKARIMLMGPSGGGKTKTALMIAAGLVGPNGRIAVLDTENDSASKYAGDDGVDFDVQALVSFSPMTYIEAIHSGEAEGFDAIIVDSLTHAWSGKDGALEQVDRAAKRSQGGNSFMAWRDVTPMHNALVDALVRCKCHLIATLRTKTEYVLEDVVKNGKNTKVPRRIGLAPIQRDGMEYEFDIVADITLDHDLIVTKTRCSTLDGFVVNKAGKALGQTIAAWLSDGEAPAPALAVVPAAPPEPMPADAKPDTRPARKAESYVKKPDEPAPAHVPVIVGSHKLKGKPMSDLDGEGIINYVRGLMNAQEKNEKVADPEKFRGWFVREIKLAKLYAAVRGVTDFSVSKADRAAQLKAAVEGDEEYSPELWLCVATATDGTPVERYGENVRDWTDVELLHDFHKWLSMHYILPTKTTRMKIVEACIAKLAALESELAERELAEPSAAQ